MSLTSGYNFSQCRLLGHAWLVVPSDWTPKHGEPMTTRCERCNIERRDEVNRNTGEVEARRYTYPAGYLFTRDSDEQILPRRTDFRLAWLDDQIAKGRQRRRKAKS